MKTQSQSFAELKVDGKVIRLPIVVGTEGERALDITELRHRSGLVALDPGFANTASCTSQITYVDGERGILRYRGVPIEVLVKKAMFVDVAYLLVHGQLPDAVQRRRFSEQLNQNSLLHEDMRHFFDHMPQGAHPMHILSTMINAMTAFYPNVDIKSMADNIDTSCARVISIVRTMAAFAYKKSIGEPVVYPRHDLSYCANFLNMTFARHYWGNHILFSSPAGNEMFQFPAFACMIMHDRHLDGRVAPFGNPRVKGYLHLAVAYRGLSRPSSPPRA